MKISVAWVFDHIDADWKKQDINYLVKRFNQVTAEIEKFDIIHFDLKPFAVARVKSQNEQLAVIEIPEWKESIELHSRINKEDKEQEDVIGKFCMVKKDNGKIRWATCKDFGLDKDGFIPILEINENDAKGDWKKQFETDDIILEVDNKSLTHRPDMWGHRGFAREVAAFLDLPFKEKSEFLTDVKEVQFENKSKATEANPFIIENKALEACPRFSGLYLKSAENKAANPFIISRLLKVDCRPINALVDLTNYVLFDWSQPVHIYDAENIEKKHVIIRMAKKNEKLKLLDESDLTLTEKDLVIADAKKPLCLAGVMGGLYDSISSKTKSIFFEVAHFNAAPVRRTALRYRIRTESSTRFEKTLDPNQIADAVRRFLNLAKQTNVGVVVSGDIAIVGKPFQEKTIKVTHSFFKRQSGIDFKETDVVGPLQKIGFKIEVKPFKETLRDNFSQELEIPQGEQGKKDTVYSITIPSYRGAKDVQIKEDVLEEVVRFYGLEKIPLELPLLKKNPSDLTHIFRKRKIKESLAFSAGMNEQQNYVFYDERFLSESNLNFEDCIELKNPVSENNMRLVSSLMPNLFKNIKDNCFYDDTLRFFELGRHWRLDGNESIEKKSIAGIFFERRKPVDFYDCKEHIAKIFSLCGVKKCTWKKCEEIEFPWMMKYQTAKICVDDVCVGIAGKIDKTFLNKLDALPESDGFFFELDGDYLLHHQPEIPCYAPPSKYQETTFDLSFMSSLTLQTDVIEKTLSDVDSLITKVELVDFFEKEEWTDQRSLSFRLWMSNPEKTMEKEEIDMVMQKAVNSVEKLGAKLRG
jgi:phenylalanyl-tRNA synthetase beta chain